MRRTSSIDCWTYYVEKELYIWQSGVGHGLIRVKTSYCPSSVHPGVCVFFLKIKTIARGRMLQIALIASIYPGVLKVLKE